MAHYAIDDERRQRLAEAQRAEADALRAVTVSQRRRQRLQVRVETADAELGEAHRALVEVSGFQRAVLLSGEPPAELRRLLRRGAAVGDGPGTATPDAATDDREAIEGSGP